MSTLDFTQSVSGLAQSYEVGLRAYLASNNEEMLHRAYELGRAAVLSDVGLLDMVELHQNALRNIIAATPPDEMPEKIRHATDFLEESLSPFEITHRGYRNAIELVHHITWFTSIACHEVKAPLTSILSSAGMLKEMLETDHDSSENRLLLNVLDSVAILTARTTDMMDIASLYAGSFRLRPRLIQVSSLLKHVCAHLQIEVEGQGMGLHVSIPNDLPRAELDPDRIEQVVTNLVQNAARYAAGGGRIDLCASSLDNHLLIEVRDYGRDEGVVEHIRQVLDDRSAGRDRAARGAGLGLILCRQLIAAHHGRFAVLAGPGGGSILQIWLPLRQRQGDMEGVVESSHR